jgi:hypothetical protein
MIYTRFFGEGENPLAYILYLASIGKRSIYPFKQRDKK